MGASELPTRFPCWCRATYSWGGETKRDLGFIEGDLIEALNAGDGLWWMGRLRRDPRAVGLFPSNFVKVLDESFQPAAVSRNASPLTQRAAKQASLAKTGRVFRKAFQAYEELDGRRSSFENARSKEGTPESDKEKAKPKSKFGPYSSMKTAPPPRGTLKKQSSTSPLKVEDGGFRVPSPPPRRGVRSDRPSISRPASANPMIRAGAHASPTSTPMEPTAPPAAMSRAASPQPGYRAPSPQPLYRAASPQQGYQALSPARSRPHSPLPDSYHDGSAFPQLLLASRGPSPSLYQQQQYHDSRAPSPAPSFRYQPHRAPSPLPFDEDVGSSPPPPPPPAHRIMYQPSRAPSPQPQQFGQDVYDRNGSHTPPPPSPGGGSHMTPSPLREAMNDVMSSLQDMSVLQQSPPPLPARAATPPSVWSPDAFDDFRSQSRQHMCAQSSLGFERQGVISAEDGSRMPSLPFSGDKPPQLTTYVQRMERQLRHQPSSSMSNTDQAPLPPLKGAQYSSSRPTTASSQSSHESNSRVAMHSQQKHPHLCHRKSAYELGSEALNRTFTTKTSATNSTESSSATQSSNSTQLTSRSIMSGYSAGGFSATSAGSLARRKFGLGSQKHQHPLTVHDTRSNMDLGSSARSTIASDTSGSGPSYHESHASFNQALRTPTADWTKDPIESAGVLGGLSAPKARKSGFFKKMIESAKTTARTGAANARSTIGSTSGSRPGSSAGTPSPAKSMFGNGPSAVAGGTASRPASAAGGAARDMGLGGGGEWMQLRRDVNRSNSLSRREREERAERCEMLDLLVLNPIDQLLELAEGDEGLDGLPIAEPTDFNTLNLALVDKSTRFINSVPPMISATALAQSYVCRPHRSDVQRLRAIFTWVAERITWEEAFEGQVDTRRVIQTKRGCSEEIALLVRDMCLAVGLHAEVVRGYLKSPGEDLHSDTIARTNHWWNTVIVDGGWRVMDCSLASPTHPRRGAYNAASAQAAEAWYFLARPLEICYTHIPLLPEQQHIVPPVEYKILCALPCAGPTYFKHQLELTEFDTSGLHLEKLEMAHFHINVPEDVECIADTEAKAFAQDADGDFLESGDVVTKKALAQPEWVGGRKRFTIKALLPGDEGQGVLKIYAGKRGLMHSIKDNPHSLALALPLSHTGQNPPYDFFVRHPTPHSQRHDLYVVQPQCSRLVVNNTFVFCVRQHPSSLSRFTPDTWGSGMAGRTNSANSRPTSPNPYARPGSAMSMVSTTISVSQSDYSSSSGGGPMTAAQQKPAKLAIQSPSQKIIRLTRKQERSSRVNEELDVLTTVWETVIKIGERGTWRGLVLADRSARWCVFAEWECV